MKLHSIALSSFRQHADTLVEFAPGLTGIIGANGSGKSTILEAVAFALYGVEATRGTKDTLRWSGAPATRKASVSLEFGAAGGWYMVNRSETDATLLTEKEGDVFSRTIAKGTTAVTAAVVDLLGLTYKEFAATYLCNQKDLLRLSTMGPTERQAFMRRVMGVERLDDAVKGARAKLKDAKARREGMAAGLGERGPLEVEHNEAAKYEVGTIFRRDETRKAAEARYQDVLLTLDAVTDSDLRKTEHDRLTREREQAERDAAAAEREVQRLTAELEQAEAAAARVAEQEGELAALPGLRRERDDLTRAEVVAGRRAHLIERVRAGEVEHETVLETLADAEQQVAAYDRQAHEEAAARLEALRAREAELKQERQSLSDRLGARAEALFAERDALQDKADALGELGAEGACPTCTQPLTVDALRAAENALREEAEKRQTDGSALLQQEGAENLRLTEALKVLQQEIAPVESACEARVVRMHDARDGKAATERLQAEIVRLDTDLNNARTALASLPAMEFNAERAAAVAREIERLEALDRALAEDRVRAGKMEELAIGISVSVDEKTEALMQGAYRQDLLEALAFDPAEHARLEQAAESARQAREDARTALATAEAEVRAAEARRERAAAALAEYDTRAEALAEATEGLRVQAKAEERLNAFRAAQVAGIRPELEELVSGFVATLTDGRYESAVIDEGFGVTLYKGGVATDVISGGEEDVVAIALRLATSYMIAQRAGRPLECLILDEPFGSQDEQRRRNILDLVSRRLRGMFEQVVLVSHHADVEQAVDNAVLVELDEQRGCSAVRALEGVGA